MHRIQKCRDTGIQCYMNIAYTGIQRDTADTGMQGYRETWIQGWGATCMHGYRKTFDTAISKSWDTMLQQGIQGYRKKEIPEWIKYKIVVSAKPKFHRKLFKQEVPSKGNFNLI